MKKLNIMLEDELATLRSDLVPRLRQRQCLMGGLQRVENTLRRAVSCVLPVLVSLVTLGPASAMAADGTATFGAPTSGGSITVNVYIPGVAPNTATVGGVVANLFNVWDKTGKILLGQGATVKIPIGSGTVGDGNGKSTAVALGLKQVFGPWVGKDPNNPNAPTVLVNHDWAGTSPNFSVAADTTGEPAVGWAVAGPGGGAATNNQVRLQWDILPTGLDVSGNPSVFSASLGYDGLNDIANVNFAQLGVPTLGGLATAMYNQLEAGLPTALQPNLQLDLQNNGLTFVIPDGSNDPFMSNTTTDVAGGVLGGIDPSNVTMVPEPSTWVLLCLGALSVLTHGWRRQST